MTKEQAVKDLIGWPDKVADSDDHIQEGRVFWHGRREFVLIPMPESADEFDRVVKGFRKGYEKHKKQN